MFKITGLDKITRELGEAQKAFAEIDGELGTVNFDPNDPASIEAAIQGVEEMIDAKLGNYASNSIVAPMVDEMKEKYREAIIEKAAGARLGDGED
ncbi:hypothetical protein Sphch_0748 [Sphingobium chlorophenolicum L-1]|uniref:Uncharacterized protein n=1 Tax=Sphingobium chlorophenolicum L-1 TaxID=690566 RepID=F6EZT2_SPHCR|nr:hypothetical protein [Sphingobium chlorophenolicum]AEG48443.1 hypothetical protein Sphch_0748 [Sphingobium chlorophenolicum L-1]